MRKEIPLVEQKLGGSTSKGLMPVVCYDPWFPRALESIKQSINDGHPVLIRLHSGASYPAEPKVMYQNDLESHAVLIIGYDDSKESVIVMDPWDKTWGGKLGGKRLITYAELSIATVDCSRGFCMCLAPFELNLEPIWKPNGRLDLELKMGFYNPRGTIMDLKTWIITQVEIEFSVEGYPLKSEQLISGKWKVDDTLSVRIPLAAPSKKFEVNVKARAKISGTRPYPFEDCVQTINKFAIEKPGSLQIEEYFEESYAVN